MNVGVYTVNIYTVHIYTTSADQLYTVYTLYASAVQLTSRLVVRCCPRETIEDGFTGDSACPGTLFALKLDTPSTSWGTAEGRAMLTLSGGGR